MAFVSTVAATEEQAWNNAALTAPGAGIEIRFWTYSRPAVVVGPSQRRLIDPKAAFERSGLDVVQRASGGGAVLVGPWLLSASIVIPHGHPMFAASPVLAYYEVGRAFAATLAGIGIQAEAVDHPDRAALLSVDREHVKWACFGSASAGEVIQRGRKLVGLAQTRKRTGVLIAAGLLVRNLDWTPLCSAMDKPLEDATTLARLTVDCEEILGVCPSLDSLCVDLLDRLRRASIEWPHTAVRSRTPQFELHYDRAVAA